VAGAFKTGEYPIYNPNTDSKVPEPTSASPYLVTAYPNVAWEDFTVALIGPNQDERTVAYQALTDCRGVYVTEVPSYPDELLELPRLLEENYDVILIEMDSNPEAALRLVELIGAQNSGTVMVYSSQTNPEMLVRCMRSGAREFLPMPFTPGAMEEALVRASVRRPKVVTRTIRAGRLLVFMGAKGGVGVTSIATNFAVALAQVPHQKTLLIDLDLPLGDAALNLGVTSDFSTIDALQAVDRLDAAFLSKLLVKHRSGLRVLAAPGRFPKYEPSAEAIERLIAVARREFDCVVVDVGSHLDPIGTPLHRDATAIYLVTQAGIPELRNANRLISQVFNTNGPKLELVLNRFQSRTGIADKHITEALTRPANWKVPNDHALVRKMQIDASPLVLSDNSIARTIREMAQAANGKTEEPEDSKKKKKKGLGIFG
jgi:pilus assembly protein CpaE